MSKRNLVTYNSQIWNKLLRERLAVVFGDDWEDNHSVVSGTGEAACGLISVRWGWGKRDFEIRICKRKKLHDLNQETPALLYWRSNGSLSKRMFFQDGSLNDPERGVSAVEEYFAGGRVKEQKFYQHGMLHSQDTESPAVIVYYNNGVISECRYLQQGEAGDTPSGKPSVVLYDRAGNIIGGWSQTIGRKLLSRETADILAEAKEKAALTLCSQEN